LFFQLAKKTNKWFSVNESCSYIIIAKMHFVVFVGYIKHIFVF